jgi:hypothetical protein
VADRARDALGSSGSRAQVGSVEGAIHFMVRAEREAIVVLLDQFIVGTRRTYYEGGTIQRRCRSCGFADHLDGDGTQPTHDLDGCPIRELELLVEIIRARRTV